LPVPENPALCEIVVLLDTPLPIILLFNATVPLIIEVTVSVFPEINPRKAAVAAPTPVEIPVMVGAPVEDTALYL
jgi:hypothetical protein